MTVMHADHTPPAPFQLDDEERLMRTLIELRPPGIGSPMDSLRAYDDLHGAGALCQRDSFYLWLLGLLRPRRGETLLDVSCGQGELLGLASDAGLIVSGLDLSPVAVEAASRRAPRAAISVGNAEQLPYADHTFIYVTNIGSVEHYIHPARALREMARVLRPDGRALILLPNTYGLLGNVLHVWRTGDVFDDGQPVQRYGTNGQWRQLLESNGLAIGHVHKYERAWPRTWDDLAWYLVHPYRIVRPLLATILPVNLSSFMVYLCSKA